jgi:EAL domain-containing protein (putative c-di-GMP-specific phosphodiesterase class I)
LQRDILDDLGCDEGQGPLFGSAMPASLFNASLAMPADI